jgi:hypothetical protein
VSVDDILERDTNGKVIGVRTAMADITRSKKIEISFKVDFIVDKNHFLGYRTNGGLYVFWVYNLVICENGQASFLFLSLSS